MNSRVEHNPNQNLCGMGNGFQALDQKNVLDRMENFLKKFSVFDTSGKIKTARQPWQIGIQCSINATRALHNELVVKGTFKYLLTARVNQDCLENFFSRIRGTFFVDKILAFLNGFFKKAQICTANILNYLIQFSLGCTAHQYDEKKTR